MYINRNRRGGNGRGLADRIALTGILLFAIALVGLGAFYGNERIERAMEFAQSDEYREACRDRQKYWESLPYANKLEMRNYK